MLCSKFYMIDSSCCCEVNTLIIQRQYFYSIIWRPEFSDCPDQSRILKYKKKYKCSKSSGFIQLFMRDINNLFGRVRKETKKYQGRERRTLIDTLHAALSSFKVYIHLPQFLGFVCLGICTLFKSNIQTSRTYPIYHD